LYKQTLKAVPAAEVMTCLDRAGAYTRSNPEFDTFNRLEFIREYLMPLSIALEHDFLQVIDASPNLKKNKPFSGTLADLMQGKLLNPDAFTPFAASATTPEKIALGKALFHDASLSRSNRMKCASCHDPKLAFTDARTTSLGSVHSNTIRRNAPTVLYAGFQKTYFYDARSQDLENQIQRVMENPDEFNLPPADLKMKIEANSALAEQFKRAYPDKKEITAFEIRNAIAAYVRSLMPFTSKTDRYFQGTATLTARERNGFNLFAGKAKCATCHFIPVFNGTIPPWFNNSESEVIGVPEKKVWANAEVDDDPGRFTINPLEQLRYSFKTPTVRNIEKTAPYMHNGVYHTMEEVVRFYKLGGGNGIGMNLAYQTLPFDHLQLTDKEAEDLVLFLKTLTDTYENR
jgi:cytochrome c peroxidase